ncbi:C2 calcium-dependent membrane targeting [Corchorus olitorius]|uniref:C2 calcium-dependent membrane targeting n=1 Tax=Corchorus olitorius TaxID=93759 RepID=A0A1R3HRP3_9ROSI|nr:C2 calcium-dependent membrane targeting [Corchorus olitorius]
MAQNFALKEIKPNIGKGRVTGTGPDRLTSSRDLVEETYYLFVRVVKVKELPWNAALGICDPFVEIKVGNYKGRTSFLENKPDWNEVFAFRKERIQTSTMDIVVRERALPNDEIIGKICFNMSDIPTRVPPDSPLAPQWYKLDDKNGIYLGMGELMLAIWFGTQADEVFPNAWNSDLTLVNGDSIVNTRSKVYIQPKLWYLRVSIVEGQDLVSKSKTPEVYVKANLGFVSLKTRVSSNKSLNPKWGEDLMFVAAEPFDESLILTVVEKLEDKTEVNLGKCEIPVSKVSKRNLPEAVGAKWYDLKQVVTEESSGQAKDAKFATKLSMKVSLDGGYHVFDEPVHVSSDFRPSYKVLWPGTIGLLELGILGATGLIPMKSRNGRETTDAYCVAKYGPKWIRTRTAVDTFAPKWNEQYVWDIYEPYSVLTIGIFDNCHLHGEGMLVGPKDPKIGKLRIRLSTLRINKVYTYSYPIIAMQPTGIKKMGELQLSIRFTCPSYQALCKSYFRPLIPKMHIIFPLSVYQLDSLRQQTVEILSMRLTRTEPPLRKEVVECMLDADAQMWSMRRAKANFERLKAVFGVFVNAWKVFNDLRKWRNWILSLSVLVAGVIVVFCPTEILLYGLPFLPLSCAFVLFGRFRKLPKDPPFMNVKLSLAESVNADDLDEEFDSFPSSKQGDVLRMRYDRLRSFAAKIMHMIGDLACHGERINSLWSGEDPRAPKIFLFACLVAALCLHWISYFNHPWNWKIIAACVWLYVMRCDWMWRKDVPSVPSIFFRKLPTKVDRLL